MHRPLLNFFEPPKEACQQGGSHLSNDVMGNIDPDTPFALPLNALQLLDFDPTLGSLLLSLKGFHCSFHSFCQSLHFKQIFRNQPAMETFPFGIVGLSETNDLRFSERRKIGDVHPLPQTRWRYYSWESRSSRRFRAAKVSWVEPLGCTLGAATCPCPVWHIVIPTSFGPAGVF